VAKVKADQTWPIFILPLTIRNGDKLKIVEHVGSATGATVRASKVCGDETVGILMIDGTIARVGSKTHLLPFFLRGEVRGDFVVVTW
jgi:hypothetical protein